MAKQNSPLTAARHLHLALALWLPQEASSYQPAVRPERRRQVQDEMLAYAPQARCVGVWQGVVDCMLL